MSVEQQRAWARRMRQRDDELTTAMAIQIVMECVAAALTAACIAATIVIVGGWGLLFKVVLGSVVVLGALALAVFEVEKRL